MKNANELANAICGCATPEQRKRDVAAIEAFVAAAVAEVTAQRDALLDVIEAARDALNGIADPAKVFSMGDPGVLRGYAAQAAARISAALQEHGRG